MSFWDTDATSGAHATPPDDPTLKTEGWDVVFDTTKPEGATLTRDCGCTLGWASKKQNQLGFRFCHMHESIDKARAMIMDMYAAITVQHFSARIPTDPKLAASVRGMLEVTADMLEDYVDLDVDELMTNGPDWSALFARVGRAMLEYQRGKMTGKDITKKMRDLGRGALDA